MDNNIFEYFGTQLLVGASLIFLAGIIIGVAAIIILQWVFQVC